MEELLAIITALSLTFTLLAHAALHRKLSRPPGAPLEHEPGISVLKPLKGLDDNLEENLRSFARQNYENYELIFGTEDPNDPALDVAHRIKLEFPDRSIRIVTGAPAIGRNPKVSNVAHLARYARAELLLISDSNVRVPPSYLTEASALLAQPKVGMVCHLIVGTGDQTIGATLENLQLCSFIASSIALGDMVGHPCVVGKSMLFRAKDLEKVGGFSSVKDLLAEDYTLGRAFHAAGLKVVLSSQPIETINMTWSVRRFFSRHLRWAQMRRRINPLAYSFEPLLHVTPWLLLLAMLQPQTRMFAALGLTIKVSSELAILIRLQRSLRPLSDLAFIPVKDLSAAIIWPIGLFKKSVEWRGRTLYLGSGSVLVDEKSPEVFAADTRS